MIFILHLGLALVIAASFMIMPIVNWNGSQRRTPLSATRAAHPVPIWWCGVGVGLWGSFTLLFLEHPPWMIWAGLFALIEPAIWYYAFLRECILFKG